MNLLSEQVVPDQDGNVQLELFGGPADGAWIETVAPQGPISIKYEDRWRYQWDGTEPLSKLVYEEDVELEQHWLALHTLDYEED